MQKKRKHRIEQVPEIVFDETARRDFLTGFHKRKLERKAKAKENALQFSKKERAKARKAAKESLKEQVKQRLAKLQEAINRRNGIIGQTDDEESDKNEETDNDDEKNNQESNVIQTEFRSADNTKTTVTIIEDFDISESFGNVTKKQRIDEVKDHNKEIPTVPEKNLEQKSTSVNKNLEKGSKKKYRPRNKTRRSKTKKFTRSKSRRNKNK